MTSIKLQAAREFILSEQYGIARTILQSMKSSLTATKWLERLDSISPEQSQNGGQAMWEYLEVYVKASDRMPAADLSAVLENQELTTVDHFYSRMLNEYGAAGWEVISEEQHGGDVVRLLFKRLKP